MVFDCFDGIIGNGQYYSLVNIKTKLHVCEKKKLTCSEKRHLLPFLGQQSRAPCHSASGETLNWSRISALNQSAIVVAQTFQESMKWGICQWDLKFPTVSYSFVWDSVYVDLSSNFTLGTTPNHRLSLSIWKK